MIKVCDFDKRDVGSLFGGYVIFTDGCKMEFGPKVGTYFMKGSESIFKLPDQCISG